MTKILGVDISEWNGAVNFNALKAGGVRFVIIRDGYGTSHKDTQFENNIKGALAAGMKIGIYHFSYALSESGAKNEANYVISLLKQYKDKITLPVYYDFEYDTVSYAKRQGVTLGKAQFNSFTVAFCETIKNAGYTPGTYFNGDYYSRYVDMNQIGKYSTWFATYGGNPKFTGYDMWQYTSSATFVNANGRFDANYLVSDAIWNGKAAVTAGWRKNDTGWWYVHEDGSYTTNAWEFIDNKWYYFDEKGYMLADSWILYKNEYYYLRSDGSMETNKVLTLDDEGHIRPGCYWYEKLGDVTSTTYRTTLDKLIDKGIIKGYEGTGDDMVIKLSEESVRLLVFNDRAGLYD